MSIFTKEKIGTPCSFCPNVIHVHNEPNGVLFVASGKPICATCRIMRKSKFAVKMQSDAKKAHNKVDTEKVEDVAVASQTKSDADSDKKKELQKKMHKN